MDKMTSISCIFDLKIWREARSIRIDISALAKTFPPKEKFKLQDQIVRSSRSIAANIAEGFGRYHYKENIHFCLQARGSITETMEHLCCAFDEHYISKDQFHNFTKRLQSLLRMLNAYIRSTNKQAKSHT